MSVPQLPTGLSADALVGDALRALPLATPPVGAWAALEAELQRSLPAKPAARPRWRYAVPLALAASLALALLLPRVATTPTSVPTSTAPLAANNSGTPAIAATTDSDTDLDALRQQSQRLETWLQRLSAGNAPLDGQNLMAAAEVEDLIGLVDVQLAGAGSTPEIAALWRRRIALLEDLGAIRTATFSQTNPGLVDTGTDAQGRAQMPRHWIN